MPESLEHRFAHTNGIRMHYVEQGEGPLVLLCHGWPECWYSWRQQMPVLAAAGFRVVAPDQRGYGQTDAPTAVESYDILQLAGDLVGLVNALGEQQAILIGHDWGSIVAQTAALLRPDLFRALGLLSVPYLRRTALRPAVRFALATQESQHYQVYFQQPDLIERELEEDVRRSLLGLLYTASGDAQRDERHRRASFARFPKHTRMVDNLAIPETLPAWLTGADLDYLVAQYRHSGFRGGIHWYRNLDRNWALTPFLDGARIQQKTLFVAGALDGVLKFTAEDYQALPASVPTLVGNHLIPEAGHWVHQEQAAKVNDLLQKFLSDLA